jgi:hypothetical protein
MITMDLDDVESTLILAHREKLQSQKKRTEKRANCKHEFIYEGHNHNYDVYVCQRCGELEER